MFYLIGLGLGDASDISVKGLEIVRRCDTVYLEAYTSILTCDVAALEALYGRAVTLADREMVEQGLDSVIGAAGQRDVALLVVGDPFAATTHHDLVVRARRRGVPVRVVHNASIMTAVGCCGLQLYSFGETVSVPFWTDDWRPDSFVARIDNNLSHGQHTLCLLDIKFRGAYRQQPVARPAHALPAGYQGKGADYREPDARSSRVRAAALHEHGGGGVAAAGGGAGARRARARSDRRLWRGGAGSGGHRRSADSGVLAARHGQAGYGAAAPFARHRRQNASHGRGVSETLPARLG